jgi:hypothetical protein
MQDMMDYRIVLNSAYVRIFPQQYLIFCLGESALCAVRVCSKAVQASSNDIQFASEC